MDILCQPLLNKTITEKNMYTESVGDICRERMEDMEKLHKMAIREELSERRLKVADIE